MKTFSRLAGIFALAAIVAVATPLFAQINIGGLNSGGNQNNQDDDDDSNNNNNQNSNRNSNRNRNSSGNQSGGNSDAQKIQQFLQGGQGGQGGQSGQGNQQFEGNQYQGQGSNQFRRNQQGQNQQNQNWQQNWQQNNQSGITIGTWNGGKWNGTRKIDNWNKVYGGGDKPFSQQWYQAHPKAWKYNNNNADIWVVASMPGVYNWLGWGNVPQEYQGNYGGHAEHFDHSHYGDWYPLGVFSLMSSPGDTGTRIVQLVIDRHGHIAGNYYDMITGSNYSVSGEVSRQSQRVTWSLNKNPNIRFRAHISQLLQPYGTITVRMPGGEQQWQFVRLEN